uniref:BACK domain-containing protein n=1 Tax=Branchiostoma floridae TaxID=7739 RepID=C3Y6T3_BRAFL|eukprot:XP_002608033.1 hypothetical protein BRAFLDRAFT_74983 [Branchiostoma floridae]
MKEFTAVTETPEFLELTKEQLITLISSDELNAPEETVYASVLKWIKHAPRKRKKEMKELMELIRFPWMDKMYFIENVQTDKALCKICPDIVTDSSEVSGLPRGDPVTPYPSPPCQWTEGGSSGHWRDGEICNGRKPFSGKQLNRDDTLPCTDKRQLGFHELAPMNTGRDFHKLVVVQGKAYAIGGRISYSPVDVTTNVEVYDRSLNKWAEGVPLLQARYHHAVAVLDGSIYVMGGRGADNLATSTVYRFSPAGDCQWHSASDMPNKACDITASVLNGCIYVAGVPSNVLCYRPQEDLWTVVVNTGTGLRCGMTVFGGEIYICGGYENENATTKVLRFNQQDKSLKQVGTMPKGLFGHGCVTILKG